MFQQIYLERLTGTRRLSMATMVDEPYVTHVPTLAGGVGGEGVRRFYGDHFIGHWPDDVSITHVSRTVGDFGAGNACGITGGAI